VTDPWDALPERMRALLPDDSVAVSADEAMGIAVIRAKSDARRRVEGRGPRWPRRSRAERSRKLALVWLGAVTVLVLALVVGLRDSSPQTPSSGPASNASVPTTKASHLSQLHPQHLLGTWSSRTIASTAYVQDVAPTSDGVFWLKVPGTYSAAPAPVTPVRYVPATGRMTNGPSVVGFVGSPAITDTGGWLWVTVGVGNKIEVEQLNLSGMKLQKEFSLYPTDGLAGAGLYPVLTATVAGPLWVAGENDLWELDPSTGAVEGEFNTDIDIDSMSTDPTGALLYVGGQNNESEPVTIEYNAQTGALLKQVSQFGATPSIVAATDSGVWVSYETGLEGRAFELSAAGLKQIAGGSAQGGGKLGTYFQTMGVLPSVSEETLWLSSTAGLTCADPTSGEVRAVNRIPAQERVYGAIASGRFLYAVEGKSLILLTPPAKCFG